MTRWLESWLRAAVVALWLPMVACTVAGDPGQPGRPRGWSPDRPIPTTQRDPKRLPEECLRSVQGRLQRRPGQIPGATDLRLVRADLLEKQGVLDEAYALTVDVLCAWHDEETKSHVLWLLAWNRRTAGDLEAATWFAERLLVDTRGGSTLHAAARANALLLLGNWYVDLGDEERARARLSEAESLLREGPEPKFYALLATAYVRLRDTAGWRRALALWEERAWDGPAGIGGALYKSGNPVLDLSLALLEAGEVAEAKRFAQKALDTPPSVPGELAGRISWQTLEGPGVAEALARVSIAEGEGEAALRYLREADQVARERAKPGPDFEYYRRLRQRLRREPEGRALEFPLEMTRPRVNYLVEARLGGLMGEAHALMGQPREAVAKLLDAVELIESLRGLVGARDRMAFFAQYAGPYARLVDTLLSLEPGAPLAGDGAAIGRAPEEVAFYYADAARSRSLSEQIAGLRLAAVEGRVSPGMIERERALVVKASAELSSGRPFRESPAYRELQTFIAELRRTHPDYAALKYPLPVSVSQTPLNDGESLLAYSLLPRYAVAWLLRPGQPVRVFRSPVARDRVLQSVAALRTSLEPDPGGRLPPFDVEASERLYRWLLEEPLARIPPGSRIIVVPDAALATIPFEALGARHPDGTATFAIERYVFAYAPSASFLAHQRKGRPPAAATRGRLLALGDPVYTEADPRVGRQVPDRARSPASTRGPAWQHYAAKTRVGLFSRLPWTGEEVRQVAAVLGSSQQPPDVRLGPAANERDLKRLDFGGYRYLHLATHGVLAEDLPYLLQPALVLTQVGDLGGEDGFLTMEEVLGLKLNTELTVLSACQTALGREISGEGVVGLMRAFLHAGSRTVVVSLWRVDDESTATLMGRFYRHVARGVPFVEALNQAKQDLLSGEDQRVVHPFFWAPFILYSGG